MTLYIQLRVRVVDGDSLFVLRDAPSLDPRHTILLSPCPALPLLYSVETSPFYHVYHTPCVEWGLG